MFIMQKAIKFGIANVPMQMHCRFNSSNLHSFRLSQRLFGKFAAKSLEP